MGLPSTLFVKFNSPELAGAAVEQLNGQPFDLDMPQLLLKAEFARREMEVRPSALLPTSPVMVATNHLQQQVGQVMVGLPGIAAQPAGSFSPPPVKRMGVTGGELTTIVVFSLKEKGITPADLQAWFAARPGFSAMQMNERIDGMFVRFDSALNAEQALRDANAQNVGAEWARRNLDDDRQTAGAPLPLVQPQPAMQPVADMVHPQWAGAAGAVGFAAPPAKRGATNELLTICVLGLGSKEVSPETLQEWFQQCPGFDRMQLNERIGGLFVKFFDQQHAENALNEANRQGFGAEWARRNLDDDPTARAMHAAGMNPLVPAAGVPAAGVPFGVAPAAAVSFGGKGSAPKRPRMIVGGDIDTITVLGVREKATSVGDLQQWFASRPGYVALQINDKIDGMFVKFSSRVNAEAAMADSNAMGLGAEWARRNLDL